MNKYLQGWDFVKGLKRVEFDSVCYHMTRASAIEISRPASTPEACVPTEARQRRAYPLRRRQKHAYPLKHAGGVRTDYSW